MSFATNLRAVLRFDFTTSHSLGAAVTAIIPTPFVVVLVVAVAVSLVIGHPAFWIWGCWLTLVVWINTNALETQK